jgi:two-component system NarL family sensor kinase
VTLGEHRIGRWVRDRATARLASNAVVLLVVLVLAAALLAFDIPWNRDWAPWLVLAATFTPVGAAVVSRVPRNSFGWVALAIGATSALAVGTWTEDLPAALAWLRSWILVVPVGLLPVALLVFPTGRLHSRRWRPALALAIAGASATAFFLAVASTIAPDPLGFFGSPGGVAVDGLVLVAKIAATVTTLSLLLGVLSLLARLRAASDIVRRQVLCLLIGAVVLFVGLALDLFGVPAAWFVGAAAVPIAAGVAILWHELYDLDLFISRSVVYLGLSALLLAAFGAIIVLGDLVASRALPHGTLTLIAVALVALGLDPLRRRLQHAGDRVLYGHRNDPYAAVTALGRGLGAPGGAPATLDDVAEAVGRSLALPYVAIEIGSDEGESRLAEWGRRYDEPVGVALTHRGEQIARLLATPRTVHGRLSDRDRKLLEDIAHPVALTVNAVELAAKLQRVREQLVTAREEERRRLRRDLHDGLGPTLAGLVMQLDAASNVLRRDPAAVEPLLAGLRTAAQDAVGDIRRLVYELRPPALDELGLVGAILELTDRFSSSGGEGLRLSLDAPSPLPALPAAVEVAALRIVQEAVTNVARHSRARSCRVRLATSASLAVEIEDDGRGMSGDELPGVGLQSMRERAAELGGTCTITSAPGGGTRVRATLPFVVA